MLNILNIWAGSFQEGSIRIGDDELKKPIYEENIDECEHLQLSSFSDDGVQCPRRWSRLLPNASVDGPDDGHHAVALPGGLEFAGHRRDDSHNAELRRIHQTW